MTLAAKVKAGAEPTGRRMPTAIAGAPLFALVALVLEGGLFAAAVTNRVSLPVALLLHLACVGLLVAGVALWQRRGTDVGGALGVAVMVAVAGPMGALGGLLISGLSQLGREDDHLLASWYSRIALSVETDAVTRLSDHVAIGRSVDLGAPMPDAFAAVLTSGPIAEQQAILGLIARRFHPDHLPALQIALQSPLPVIRVQAAAVAAKVRGGLADAVDRMIERSNDPTLAPDEGVRIAAEARRCIESGLLEDHVVVRARGLVDSAEAHALTSLMHDAPVTQRASEADDLLDSRLLATGRFAEFRHRRRRQAWARRGGYWRLKSRPAPLPAAARGAAP